MTSRTATMARSLGVLLAAFAVLVAGGVSATAQEPYPPGPPGDPTPNVTCDFRAEAQRRVAECTGTGLKPGSELRVSVTVDGGAQAGAFPLLATVTTLAQADGERSATGTVSADRSAVASLSIGCDVTGTVTVAGAGEAPDDPDGDPSVTDTLTADLADFPCTGQAAGASSGGGGLAFTGSDLLLLLVVALLLLLAGYGLLRSRRRVA